MSPYLSQEYVESITYLKKQPYLQSEFRKRLNVVPLRASSFMVGNIRNEDRGGYILGRRYIHQIP